MPYYSLLIADDQRYIQAVAPDRAGALLLFAEQLGHEVTDEDNGSVAPYLLDEWTEGPHWTNPTIPIFKV